MEATCLQLLPWDCVCTERIKGKYNLERYFGDCRGIAELVTFEYSYSSTEGVIHLQRSYSLSKNLFTYKEVIHLQRSHSLTKKLFIYKEVIHFQRIYSLTKKSFTYKEVIHLQRSHSLTKKSFT